jgi:hypothetical protein
MKARHAVLAAAAAAVMLASVAAAGPDAAKQRVAITSSPALDADVVSHWNTVAQAETVLLRPTAHGQSRGIAMVEGAVYDAVNAIDRGYQAYLLDDREFDPSGSQGAAAATAAYRVLLAITPAARHAGLDTVYATTMAAIPDGAS